MPFLTFGPLSADGLALCAASLLAGVVARYTVAAEPDECASLAATELLGHIGAPCADVLEELIASSSSDATESANPTETPSEPSADVAAAHPDPAANGLLHASGCPWCGDAVYAAEQLVCFEREWHKRCFRCIGCSKRLTLGQQLDHDQKPYCKACHTRHFGPKGYGFGGAVSAAEHAVAHSRSEVVEAWEPTILDDIRARRSSVGPAHKGDMLAFAAARIDAENARAQPVHRLPAAAQRTPLSPMAIGLRAAR
ncbi:hypothetical protein KFE25_011392 [Diacronema lutheri]|uniref:LIM zinc-binding domain-containing protein n=1 Tax=Diacronema lutheri TaxID=2081491 RepID=A0A8J5XBR3_DIALT|nr:hypothetical protein KFE25_011392 [Diacronema lutheri]